MNTCLDGVSTHTHIERESETLLSCVCFGVVQRMSNPQGSSCKMKRGKSKKLYEIAFVS